MGSGSGLTVCVGSAEEMHSSVWRYWAQRDELYATQVGLGEFYKLSFHSSGRWRAAMHTAPQTPFGGATDPDPRVIHRWQRPEPFSPGWTQCFDLCIASVRVARRFDGRLFDKKPNRNVTWVDPPTHGTKVTLTLLLADPAASGPEQVMRADDQVVGSFSLSSGSVAWLIARRERMTDVERKHFQFMADDMKINWKEDPRGVAAVVMSIETDHAYPVLTEVALGWDNVNLTGG